MRLIFHLLAGAALAGAVGLGLGFGFGCAGPQRVQWPDDSARIDEAMAPPPQGEVIPEGIALGNDAPPLKAEPQAASPYGAVYGGGIGFGFANPNAAPATAAPPTSAPPLRGSAAPLPVPQPVGPSAPPRGGTTPGLLP